MCIRDSYNSGQFPTSIRALEKEFSSPFRMFEALSGYYEEQGLLSVSHSRMARYEILYRFVCGSFPGRAEEMRDKLTYDLYLRENVKSRPAFALDQSPYKEIVKSFFIREDAERRFLSGYEGFDSRPVSYTHLDVYKRQGTTGTTGTPMRPNRPDRPEQPDRPERPDRPDRPERPDRPDRPENPDRPNWGPPSPSEPSQPPGWRPPMAPGNPNWGQGNNRPIWRPIITIPGITIRPNVNNRPSSAVRFINAAVGCGPVSITVNDNTASSYLDYSNMTDYQYVTGGYANVVVRSSNTNRVINRTNFQVEDCLLYTSFLI